MKYNVTYKAPLINQSILNIDIETLEAIIKAYNLGKNHFTIVGKQYFWSTSLNSFQIFENTQKTTDEQIKTLAKKHNSYFIDITGEYIGENILSFLGNNVTKEFLSNTSFGENKEIQKIIQKIENFYINPERINTLRRLKSEFDLSKLIRLCDELNFNYTNQNYYSVAMIGRAIIDHIPPLFEYNNFNEVSNNYGNKSIKGSLKHLNESMRNISDGILHSHIRKNESLPNSTQVNFSQDLDILLSEIETKLKKRIIA